MVRNNNDEDKKKEIRRLLAARSPHLPGYSWCGDWIQFMRNNHPLLGIVCKYRDNPIGIGQRITLLVGSIAFGLAATNYIFLYYRFNDDKNGILINVYIGDKVYSLTYEMAVLWTLGSLLHSVVDLAVWHMMACACCMPGACCSIFGGAGRPLGNYLSIFICAIFVGLAIFAILLRANYEDGNGSDTLNELTDLNVDSIASFSFLVGYGFELASVYFLYFPIIATILFSGVLRRCIPCFGGRPKAIEKQMGSECKTMRFDDEDLL